MSEATAETHVNGAAPPAPAPVPAADAPCEDCASPGEKFLAVLAAALGVFVIVMAVDMFTGGKLTGYVRDRVPQ
jgi:hypothetical protein